ncbi:hypothetical protein [Microbacterium sp. KHB019]|uniref:hypothetical protein n=1 Tax=Microbacterium sp. KHB019 TaxID=3129770 RepID=UPI003078D30B
MEWISDVSVGDWLRARLDDDWSMHHFVPHGYEAYARVFHPGFVHRAPDAVEHPATWADAAAAFGTTLHAQASWQHLVRTPSDGDWHSRIAPDGREFAAPLEGALDASILSRLVDHLSTHTTTPDSCVAAAWEGWGGMLGYTGTGPSQASLSFSDDEVHQQVLRQSFRNPFENPFQRATWQPGVLSDEISKGARLELPDRGHVLFSSSLSDFADPEWQSRAPWGDQPLSLLWPEDRAWVMVSEIDFDSTVVAGSHELVRAICADPAIEALPIRESSSLHWDSDEINR